MYICIVYLHVCIRTLRLSLVSYKESKQCNDNKIEFLECGLLYKRLIPLHTQYNKRQYKGSYNNSDSDSFQFQL